MAAWRIRAAVVLWALGPMAASAQDAEALAARLAEDLAERQAALATAAPEAVPALLDEMAALRAALADPVRAAADLAAVQGRVQALRELYAGEPGLAQVEAAAAALVAGDVAAAEAEMDALRGEAEVQAARAARVIRAAGDLAAARGARVEAGRAFVRAAALDPTYENLAAAVAGAREASDLGTAAAYGPALLGAAVRQFGQGSAVHGQALASVAQTMLAAGQLAEAEPLLRNAVAVSRGPNGARDAGYAERLNNLGLLLRATGRDGEAEALLREAVEVDRAVLGERHPDVALRMGNLADLLAATGRSEEAGALYGRALGVALGTQGEAHPDTAQRAGALAAFLQAQGDVGAGAAWAEALRLTELAFGPGHPELPVRLAQLADRLRDTGQGEAAEGAYRAAVEVLAEGGEAARADHGRALNNLGLYLSGVGRKDEAVPLFRQAVEVLVGVLGEGDPAVATVRANLTAAGG